MCPNFKKLSLVSDKYGQRKKTFSSTKIEVIIKDCKPCRQVFDRILRSSLPTIGKTRNVLLVMNERRLKLDFDQIEIADGTIEFRVAFRRHSAEELLHSVVVRRRRRAGRTVTQRDVVGVFKRSGVARRWRTSVEPSRLRGLLDAIVEILNGRWRRGFLFGS